MMIIYQLPVFSILIIFNDLSEASINISLTLSFAAVLKSCCSFDRFFLSIFILILFFISYIFLQLMFLILMDRFCLIAQEGYQSPFFLRCRLMQ